MAESLGSLLRQKRESLGLTIEEVERHTHIHVKHLKAIEANDLSAIPSVAQARGFIRNYTAFLGITSEEAASWTGGTKPKPASPPSPAIPPPIPSAASAPTPASRTAPNPATEPVSPFRENLSTGVPTVPRPETYARPRALSDRSIAREWFRFDRIFGGIIAVIIIALLAWGGYSMIVSFAATPELAVTEPLISVGSEMVTESSATGRSTPSGTVENATGEFTPSGTVEIAPGQTPTENIVLPGTISVATPSPTSFPTPLGGVYTDVRIHITVLQRAYLLVTVDGIVKFSDRVLPGETYDFIGQKIVTISTGNGAGISMLFNGVDEGALGRFGEVVVLTYTPQGVLTPTPEATLTSILTPTPTVTPTLTVTKKP
jgi:cytoskeleton protein RodZ